MRTILAIAAHPTHCLKDFGSMLEKRSNSTVMPSRLQVLAVRRLPFAALKLGAVEALPPGQYCPGTKH
jgi:hypothetical protein